jgi:hypothetical protein
MVLSAEIGTLTSVARNVSSKLSPTIDQSLAFRFPPAIGGVIFNFNTFSRVLLSEPSPRSMPITDLVRAQVSTVNDAREPSRPRRHRPLFSGFAECDDLRDPGLELSAFIETSLATTSN